MFSFYDQSLIYGIETGQKAMAQTNFEISLQLMREPIPKVH